MSIYSERLARLKRELSSEIKKRKTRKKKFKPNQLIMIDFINGVTDKAVFEIKSMTITLKKGNASIGFRHILERHFCKGCKGEVDMLDILNLDLIISRGLKLNTVGVSNSKNIVINYRNNNVEHNVILKKERNDELIVSFYSVD